MEDEYRQRLERKVDHLNERFSVISDHLDVIDQKVTKTNGRVSKLELWKSGMIGAITVILFLVCSFVVPIIIRVVSATLIGG